MNTTLPTYTIVLLVLAAALATSWFVAVVGPRLLRAWHAATTPGRTIFAIAAGLLCAYAGMKPPAPPLSGGFLSIRRNEGVASTDEVTDEDIARGYRLVDVSTNAMFSYAMNADAVRFDPWTLHGAVRAWFTARVAPFAFPLGEKTIAAFAVFADGKLRPTPLDRAHELAPGCEDVARPPRSLAAVQGVSEFWHGPTEDGGYAFTWKDFWSRHDAGAWSNRLVSQQIELRRNGDFFVRSNDVEYAYLRIDPSDWDGDGLPNASDWNPCLSDGDWFGPDPLLPDGANSNAYFSVEVVATGANAEVEFLGDAASALPDPHFIARSGETNRVNLLKGKTYRLVASAPVTCANPSDEETEITAGDDGSFDVVRPVYVYPGNGMDTFSMCVEPEDLGGTFVWTNGCCEILSLGDDTFAFDCNRCECGGCTATGYYEYEGYCVEAWGGDCCCWWHAGDGDEPDGAALFLPVCVFLNNDNEREAAVCAEEDDLRPVSVALPLPRYVSANDIVTLRCTEGASRIRLWRNENRTSPAALPLSFSASQGECSPLYLEGVETSESIGDVAFEMAWTDRYGNSQSIVSRTTVALVTNVLVACDYAGVSSNPQPFAGQCEWTFDPANSTNVDKHLVIPYRNVVNALSGFAVRDFDVYLALELKPTGFTLSGTDAIWTRLGDTPASGAFTHVAGKTAKFSNPKVGGVYRFGVTYGGSPESQCTIALPLAGADVTGVLRSDLGRADSFVAAATNLTGRDIAVVLVGGVGLSNAYCANYRGRADNNDYPTVWKYNGVNTDSGDGCVATVQGVPVRVAKLTNLLTGYVAQRLGAYEWQHRFGQFFGTANDPAGQYSWNVGRDLAQTNDFATATARFARETWFLTDDGNKTQNLWPNVHGVDNHRATHPATSPDYDRTFYSPRYLNGVPSAYREEG